MYKLAQIYGETYLGNIIGSIALVDLPTCWCWLQIMEAEYIDVPKRYWHFIDSCKGKKKESPYKNLGFLVDKIASQASFIQLFGSISRKDPNTNLWQSWNQAVTCVKQVVIVLMAPITEDRTCHSLEVWRTSTDPILLSFFVAFGNNLLLQCDKCSPHHYFQSFNLSLPARAVWKTSV